LKTRIKIALFMLSTVFSLVIFTGLIQFNHTKEICYKSTQLPPGGKNFSLQEKVKYHYVGMEKCASVCHNNEEMGFQYNIMKNDPHSNAFKILVSEKATRYAKSANVTGNPQESFECLKCHITGGGLDSSFFAATYRKEEGVTCEACHKGPFISKAFRPKAEDCLKCHNNSVHRVHHFNFKEESAKIAHSRPETKQVS
jgi:hypothetical protein